MENNLILRFLFCAMLLTLLPTHVASQEIQPAQQDCCTNCLACWAKWGPTTIEIGGVIVSALLVQQIKDAVKKLAVEQPDVFRVLKALVNNETVGNAALTFAKPILQKISLMNDDGTINKGVMAVLRSFLSAANDLDIPLKRSKTIDKALSQIENGIYGSHNCCCNCTCCVRVTRAAPEANVGCCACCNTECCNKCTECCKQYAPIFIKIGEFLVDLIAAQTVKKSLVLLKDRCIKKDTATFEKFCDFCKQDSESDARAFGIDGTWLLKQYNLVTHPDGEKTENKSGVRSIKNLDGKAIAYTKNTVNEGIKKLVNALTLKRDNGEYIILTIKQALALGRLEKRAIKNEYDMLNLQEEMADLKKKQVLIEKNKKKIDSDDDDSDDSEDK